MPFMEAAMFGPCLPLSLLNNKGDMVCFRHRASLAFGQEHNNTTRLQQISHIVVVPLQHLVFLIQNCLMNSSFPRCSALYHIKRAELARAQVKRSHPQPKQQAAESWPDFRLEPQQILSCCCPQKERTKNTF